jgi:hypothetical protein
LEDPGIDDIKMDLQGIGWDCVETIYLAQDLYQYLAVVTTAMDCFVFHNIHRIY